MVLSALNFLQSVSPSHSTSMKLTFFTPMLQAPGSWPSLCSWLQCRPLLCDRWLLAYDFSLVIAHVLVLYTYSCLLQTTWLMTPIWIPSSCSWPAGSWLYLRIFYTSLILRHTAVPRLYKQKSWSKLSSTLDSGPNIRTSCIYKVARDLQGWRGHKQPLVDSLHWQDIIIHSLGTSIYPVNAMW